MISSESTDLYRTSETPPNNFATSKRTTGYERLTENRSFTFAAVEERSDEDNDTLLFTANSYSTGMAGEPAFVSFADNKCSFVFNSGLGGTDGDIIKINLLHSSANITGGGIVENIPRSIPNGYTANIDLSKIKVLKIFKWLKSKNISDLEMLRTFNCGIGFCLITDKKKEKKIRKFFDKKYQPYRIGYINKSPKKINFINKIKW